MILDERPEHSPVVEAEFDKLAESQQTWLVPLKYGRMGSVQHCLAAGEFADSCAIVLHRRDWRAQAASLVFASQNNAWFGLQSKPRRVEVDWVKARQWADENQTAHEMLTSNLMIPHVVLAYEDLTTESVRQAAEQLLGRGVVVVAPSTVKLGSMNYVLNPNG